MPKGLLSEILKSLIVMNEDLSFLLFSKELCRLEITMKEAIPKDIIRKNHIYQPEFLDNFFELKYIGVKVTLPKISKSPNNIGNVLIKSIARKIIKAEGIKRKVY